MLSIGQFEVISSKIYLSITIRRDVKDSCYFIALVCALVQCVHAADLTFAPNPKTATMGDTFAMDIVGTDFPVTEGGGAEFIFDPDIVELRSVSVNGAVWDTFTSNGTIDNVNGRVEGIMVATFTDPGANFTVATIEFKALDAGFTNLAPSENPVNPWASGGSAISPALVNGSVIVTSEIQRDGDLAPRGNLDGIVNAGDYLVALQIVLGNIQPTPDELIHGDVYPVNQ